MSENEPFTAKSEDGAETRVITHTNGDRTIVPGSITDDQADELAALSGVELAARVEAIKAEADVEADREATAKATQQVLDDADPATVVSTSAAGLAGPDPVTQGGTASGGEGGAGRTFPTAVPAPGTSDAETVKVAEAARADGGVTQAEADADGDGPRNVGPNI